MTENDGIGSARSEAVAFAPLVSVRNYMAPEHLWSARYAARMCGEIEGRLKGTGELHRPHRSYVISAVLSSVAFMETYINEVLQDLADSEPGEIDSRCAGIAEQSAAILREMWNPPGERIGWLERASILDKYRVSLAACGAEPFEKGAWPYQSAKKLIDLRNALVHFKPETQVSGEAHKLEKALKSEFASNQIFSEPLSPWYTIGCLGYGCAEWSHTTAAAFIDEWQARIGLEKDYKDEMGQYDSP
ncbi:hypothetical protein [Gordonia sp. (in: high G+C Gram-positive bacteria)]|uniref:hypothetical protein n=1 Tax=Gordonia sp. (in: high G+C Gram-positive bacteria) TaxID=84139 RepID=UPI00168F98FC|nr:hypothetical protein [Gordonia sp. (in: high G+C Gram-positive bacteria)]NLG45908.1 hypothetical protein [Gordonia sp. (in: high G+C Gram-positive bacteria)]